MNKLCPRIIMVLYALAVLVLLVAALGSYANVLQLAIIGIAIGLFATLLKVFCCDCPKPG